MEKNHPYLEKIEIREFSENLASRIVAMYEILVKEQKEYVLSKQLLLKGTAIGANILEEKFSEALAVARSARYYNRLLVETGKHDTTLAQMLDDDIEILIRILYVIVHPRQKE